MSQNKLSASNHFRHGQYRYLEIMKSLFDVHLTYVCKCAALNHETALGVSICIKSMYNLCRDVN